MSLPHFTNITTAQRKWEPIHKNLYEVDIVLPALVTNTLGSTYQAILLENTTSIAFPTYPELPSIEQRFKYSTRLFVGMPEGTSNKSMSIKFNINQDENKQMVTFRAMKQWYDLAWNNEDGSLHYKTNMTGTIIIYQHDKQGNVIRRVTNNNCQIFGFSGVEELIWSENAALMELEAKFMVDYWQDYYY